MRTKQVISKLRQSHPKKKSILKNTKRGPKKTLCKPGLGNLIKRQHKNFNAEKNVSNLKEKLTESNNAALLTQSETIPNKNGFSHNSSFDVKTEDISSVVVATQENKTVKKTRITKKNVKTQKLPKELPDSGNNGVRITSDSTDTSKKNPTVKKRARGRPRSSKFSKIVDSGEMEIEDGSNEQLNSEESEATIGNSNSTSETEDASTEHETQNDKNSNREANESPNENSSEMKASDYVLQLSKKCDGSLVKVFQCKICSRITNAKADLIKHIRVHTGEKPYKCSMCDASFGQITALRGHETIHSGVKKFVCDVCDKRFAIKDRLRLHMRVHTGEKPHNCKICDMSFARRSQVSQHMRIHSDKKDSYKCEECDAVYSSYHTLKVHLNKHKGIKDYQCGACGKKFSRIEGLTKHIRTVHKGSRPYTCTICHKSFKGHLQQHMRLHNGVRPYKCHLCESSFTQNSQLTVHLRIHTGERPYKCQVCGSSFAHSSACKIHMRSHTGEKPFQCALCSTSFSQLPHLKKHMKCVHRAIKPYVCIPCNDFFQTQEEFDNHKKIIHDLCRSPEEEAKEIVEDACLAKLRNRLAVLLYRISSEDRRMKFGFGNQLVDSVLKKSLESSGHTIVPDPNLTKLEELRKNILLLLRWTIPKETMEEYNKNNMTVDEVLEMLTS